MNTAVTPRHLLAAGTLALGVTLVAAPIAPINALDAAHFEQQMVALTAGGSDLLGGINFDGWTALLGDTQNSVSGLFGHATYAILPVLQQLLLNQVSNVQGLIAGDSSGILTGIGEHAQAALGAPFTPFTPDLTGGAVSGVYPSLDPTPMGVSGTGLGATALWGMSGGDDPLVTNLHLTPPGDVVGSATGEIPSMDHAGLLAALAGSDASLKPLLEFLGSPLSGVLWGGLGIVASPLVQTYTDLAGIVGDLTGKTPDFDAALNGLINAPANIIGAELNGTTLQVDLLSNSQLVSLISLIAGSDTGAEVQKWITDNDAAVSLSTPITFGGLLSPGGSLFDALGLDANVSANVLGVPSSVGLTTDGTPVGLFGSLIGTTQAIAHGLGWDLEGNPLAGLDLSGITGSAAAGAPDDIFGSQAGDLFSMLETELGTIFNDVGLGQVWQDLLSAF